MAKYMLILGGADVDKRMGNPKFAPVMLQRYVEWIQGLRESGRYVASHKLHDQTGRRLTVRGGEVIDGPFIESKDAVGGVFVLEAASLDERVPYLASTGRTTGGRWSAWYRREPGVDRRA